MSRVQRISQGSDNPTYPKLWKPLDTLGIASYNSIRTLVLFSEAWMDTDQVREVLAFLRGLAAQPESLLALKLHGSQDIVVIERGTVGEGDLVAVRLLPERRTALGRLKEGRVHWQNSRAPARDVKPGAAQMLGRVLSVIHPERTYAQPQGA
jgi:hypothetical protein